MTIENALFMTVGVILGSIWANICRDFLFPWIRNMRTSGKSEKELDAMYGKLLVAVREYQSEKARKKQGL